MQKHDEHAGEYVAAAAGTLTLSGAAMREFLAAVLERGAPFRFTARGYSMHPFIRDADVITVSPLGGRAPRVGEVVAFRGGEDRLVVHRVVAAGDPRRDAAAGYLTRGDNCPEADGCVPPGAVLGVVTRVERAGKPRRLGLGPEGALLAGLSRAGVLRPATICAYLPRRAAGGALRRAQRAPACRRVLRRLRPAFAVLPAVPPDEPELARRFGLFANLRPRRGGPDVTAFVARLRGAGGEAGRIIGFVELVNRGAEAAPFDGFWIHATMVGMRYRGMGVAEALMRQAIAAARDAGADEVRLTVFADNAPALALYRKLGFRPGGSPVLAERLDTEVRKGGHRQVALRLALKGAASAPVASAPVAAAPAAAAVPGAASTAEALA
jgi:RimJ/RimL family protein N-acetyltransferase